MTYDLINTFKEYFKDNTVVLDSYKLDNGYYYLIKKDGTLNRMIVEDNESDDYELYKYFKIRDIYSKYLNSNKALDTSYTEVIGNEKYTMLKKICSNNIYTLFFKNKCVLGLCNEQAKKDAVPINVFEEGINKYYDSLQKLGTKKEEKMILEECYKTEEIEKSKKNMLIAFKKVYEDFLKEDKPKETWIKIFLEEDEEEYKRVGNIYFSLKLFNTNDNNVKIEDEVYGVNNYNYGLNSKKPYLELKSTPYKISSLISKQQISILNNIYLWLYSNGIKENVLKLPTNWEFKGIAQEKEEINNKDMYLVKITGNNGVARIDDFQYVTNFATKIRKFTCKDYIRKRGQEFSTENIYGLEWYTSNTWISGNPKCERNYLRDSYYDYEAKIAKSMLTNWKKDILRMYSSVFFELFQKENENNFIKNLDKIATVIVENTLIEELEKSKTYTYNALNSMNLWIAFKTYFNKEGEDEEMRVNNVQEECEKICMQNGKIETDEQYYYLMGQVAFYLLNISRASKLTQDVTSPFIKANNLKRLKDELKYLYEKYNYDIYLNNPKFNNILSQLLIQEPETNVKENKDVILAGILANNIFYTKKEIKDGGNEDGENE